MKDSVCVCDFGTSKVLAVVNRLSNKNFCTDFFAVHRAHSYY